MTLQKQRKFLEMPQFRLEMDRLSSHCRLPSCYALCLISISHSSIIADTYSPGTLGY